MSSDAFPVKDVHLEMTHHIVIYSPIKSRSIRTTTTTSLLYLVQLPCANAPRLKVPCGGFSFSFASTPYSALIFTFKPFIVLPHLIFSN